MNRGASLPWRPFLVAFALLLLGQLAGCGGADTGIRPQTGPATFSLEEPQDLAVFAEQVGAHTPLLSEGAQQAADTFATERLFAPWRQQRTGVVVATVAPYGIAEGNIRERGFAENLLPWSAALWRGIAENCNAAAFPSLAPRGQVAGQIGDGNPNSAIITRNTSLRVLPTLRPMFTNPARPGQGYPFDMLQNSAIWVGTPVYVAHSSLDGAWLYCEASFASGWVPAQDVAFTDAVFRAQYQRGRYMAIVRDQTALTDVNGRFLAQAHIGAVFPLARMVPGEPLAVLLPRRDLSGQAVLWEALVEAQAGVLRPLPLTAGAVADIGNRMMGQAYGWGGLYEDRDCSATLRDLFAPFGIWLPRNSAAQGKAGAVINLENLTGRAKEQLIAERGVPFRTLLWMPGHIVLYVGQWNGKPAVFHTIWGLRTLEQGKEGRLVIGRTAVTSLEPGKTIPEVQTMLLERIASMVLLGE